MSAIYQILTRANADISRPMRLIIKTLFLFIIVILTAPLSAEGALTDYKLYPSVNNSISSLATVRIEFPEAKFLDLYGSNLYGVTLTKVDEPDIVYEPVNSHYSPSNSQSFSFRPAGSATDRGTVITEPGEYRLHFPAKCFNLCGDWYTHLAYSNEINVTYTITDGGETGFTSFFPVDNIIIRPVEGRTLREFSEISMEFPVNDEYPVVEVPDLSIVSMKRLSPNPCNYIVASYDFDFEKTLVLRFRPEDDDYTLPQPVFEPGEYVVDIPAGTIRLCASDIVNPHFELHYTVTGDPSGIFSESILSPAPGAVEYIDEIVLEYPGLAEGFNFPEELTDVTAYVANGIQLRCLNNDPDLQRIYDVYSATLEGENKVRLRFRDHVLLTQQPKPVKIATMGDYQLTVKPNTFKQQNNEFVFNPRIEARYKVTREAFQNPLDNYTLEPADGTSVALLSRMSITFPDLTDGLVYPFETKNIHLVNTDDETNAYRAVSVMVRGNTVSWCFNRPDYPYDVPLEFTKPATYRLTVEADTWSDYTDPTKKNRPISATITVNPALKFNYSLTPGDGEAVTSLSSFTLTSTGEASGFTQLEGANPVTLSSAKGISQNLSVELQPEGSAILRLPLPAEEDTYTLIIPARNFEQTNKDGVKVTNPEIRAIIRVAKPVKFGASLRPASGTKLTGISSISVTPFGEGLHSFDINRSVSAPELSGNGNVIKLSASKGDYSIALFPEEGSNFTPGFYTLSIPAGFITTVDSNGLTSSTDEITATYEITEYEDGEYSDGIFILNEGAFGSDYGSLNWLNSSFSAMSYRIFSAANKGLSLGVTSQTGDIFGHNLYVISKQADYNTPGAMLTVADARTMEMQSQSMLPDAEGRSICCINDNKAYIGTSSGIYIFNRNDNSFSGPIEGSESQSGPYTDQTGEIIRFGNRAYAVRQGTGIYVIDTDSDKIVETIELHDILTLFVTAEGRMFAATPDLSRAFIEISTSDNILTEPYSVDDYNQTLGLSWNTWRKAPLAVSVRGNSVYYATGDMATHVACYDFDAHRFTPSFISLPNADGCQWAVYGSGVSIDPMSGYVVMNAVQSAPTIAYDKNAIFFANPETGEIDDTLTFTPESDYYFPAMMIYPVAGTPAISPIKNIVVDDASQKEINMAENTWLSVGNSSLIVYRAVSADNNVCTIEGNGLGTFTINATGTGNTSLTFSADYRGAVGTLTVPVTVGDESGIGTLSAPDSIFDVYSIDGRIIMTYVTTKDFGRLSPGIYIVRSGDRIQRIFIGNNH